ncbi:MAG: DNA polymerase [Chloroflexi bacterium]|nr:MAG: DNA polymerase [Chloroflexota bacterium]
MAHATDFSAPDDAADLKQFVGADQTPGIVAVERAGESGIRCYHRTGSVVRATTELFQPWLVAHQSDVQHLSRYEQLRGDGRLNARVHFASWRDWQEARRGLREQGVSFIAPASAAEQYFVESGRGLFRGMEFSDLVRLQLDIETLGFDPQDPAAHVIMIALSINGEQARVLRADDMDEASLLDALGAAILSIDPDVIEGHNLFNFDLPFLSERARLHQRNLRWGRDGSPVRFAGEQRFKAGARTIPYQSAHVYGRHLIDTYQQVQRYDAAGALESYGLKAAVDALGRTREQRTFVPGEEIRTTWHSDRDRLTRYAIDDVLDVNTLSELALPTEFYQAQILPRTLQSIASGGPGEKVNDLLVRAYLSAGESVPLPEPPRDYPGGYTELRRVGAFSPVVKCDVESLYPAIMLTERIGPSSDTLGVFLPVLASLTVRRIAAKRNEEASHGLERARWRGIQSSLKVLINSFYGYLGYGRGYFNDYRAAEAVTLHGQRIVKQIVDQLEREGALPIEVDTDGVYFQPPPNVNDEAAERALIDSISATLGPGFRLAHDGRYRGMLSLKLKNYALLGYDGRVILKGSSLRSRREEAYLRRFVHDAVPRLLQPELVGSVRDLYFDTAERILSGTLSIDDISRTEMITDQTFTSDANRRLAEALGEERVGERVRLYQRSDGKLARATEYQADEDRNYLLRRLRDMAERFRPVFIDDAEFDHVFPTITTRTDIRALRSSAMTRQLDLFDH